MTNNEKIIEKLDKIRKSVEKERGVKCVNHSLAELLTRSLLASQSKDPKSKSRARNQKYQDEIDRTISKLDKLHSNTYTNAQFNNSVEVDDDNSDKKDLLVSSTVSQKMFCPDIVSSKKTTKVTKISAHGGLVSFPPTNSKTTPAQTDL